MLTFTSLLPMHLESDLESTCTTKACTLPYGNGSLFVNLLLKLSFPTPTVIDGCLLSAMIVLITVPAILCGVPHAYVMVPSLLRHWVLLDNRSPKEVQYFDSVSLNTENL